MSRRKRRLKLMALDYYLVIQDINNEIEPALVMESLSQAFYLPKKPNSGFLIGVGVTINAFKEDDEDSLFGSPYPDICVAFRIDFKYGESGINTMRKVVVWLMSYFNGDMRLFLNEQQIFQRISAAWFSL